MTRTTLQRSELPDRQASRGDAQSHSPNAQVFEPVALRWVRSTNALSIDPVRSRRASLAGAQSIAAMRRALQ
ncbi:hypothetical protein ASE65_05405 [Sphingomonas sp. Leaf16]|nr:hypothetical protein ASE65_05405 [Sphingomonas sp. Leaf16]KQN12934.1 hypothetical protein ASE81_06420 [Sphingomonas sp. Leaf29]KQN19821.1 hypothetical protein ASE83_06345 [Sphingomonas sp. Leaf32]